jgi:hypothetical protein
VAFKNYLAGCVAIKVREISTEGNVVAAHTIVTLAQSISECGCKSALATFTSSVDVGGVREVLQTGLVSLKSSGEKVFVLVSDPALIVNKKVTVTLACTGPL